jgi:hypothetical protein
MWTCPGCGRRFANHHQTHTCAVLGRYDDHFLRCDPIIREIADRVLAIVSALGPVVVLPQRTRIALQNRMSFVALMPRRRWLNGHLVLARRIDSPRFLRIEEFGPTNVLHAFRLSSPGDVDEEFTQWLQESFRVGRQLHRR